jgi:hypothetical protein
MLLSLTALQELDISEVDLSDFDLNKDGLLDIRDCPYEPGTAAHALRAVTTPCVLLERMGAEAKLWYTKILEPSLKDGIEPWMTRKYGNSVVGAYQGKPLVPGEMGHGQADFTLMVHRIHLTQGVSLETAQSIAGFVRWKKYGCFTE